MKNLEKKAKEIRRKVIELLYRHKAAHLGSCMSAIEILVSLYYKIMKKGDRFLLSPGWKAAALYSILADKKIIDWKDLLKNYYEPGSKYWGLVHHNVLGIEHSLGSAGHGLPVACGMAYALKLDKKKGRIFCLVSDGEMDCGTTWESALIAAHHKLDNLFIFVDYNKLQAFGKTNEVLNLEPLAKKWEDFNWDVQEIDGHNFKKILSAFKKATLKKGRPHIIICHTVKGKGISFAEGKLEWHYFNLTKELYEKAKRDLR
jgi:transketolase